MNKDKYIYEFSDNDSCLEWLKNRRYPDGIKCPVCGKITKHHKLINSRCYSCDNCGNRVYPTARTIFHKSTTPLKTWFEVINRISSSRDNISAKTIQREYGMTYKTAWRMVHKIKENLKDNTATFSFEDISRKADIDKISGNNPRKRTMKNLTANLFGTPQRIEGSSFADLPVMLTSHKQDNQKDYYRKRDRTARLLKLQILLWQNQQGLTIEELSKKCMTSKRTVYRDLQAIESELNIPIWEDGKKRGLEEGSFLPPITFNMEEAFNIFLASRLLQKQSHIQNPNLASTFMKISSIIPLQLRKKIQDSMEYIEQRPEQKYIMKNLSILIKAWLSQHRVKIHYQEEFSPEIMEVIIEPYFIEPASPMHSIFVIAHCPLKNNIYSYNVARIIGDVTTYPDTYEIPADFDPIVSINSAWGLQMDEEIFVVRLHFKPEISKTIMSTIWHPSQVIEFQDDGSLIVTFKVRNMSGFRSWVLSWGDEVEVLEPKAFRNQLVDFAKALLKTYSARNNIKLLHV